VKEKILEWLVTTRRSTVSSAELRDEFVSWLKSNYGYEGVLSTDRKWRELKEDQSTLVTEEFKQGRMSAWKIISFRGIPWAEYIN
jgi:hypothetical protein